MKHRPTSRTALALALVLSFSSLRSASPALLEGSASVSGTASPPPLKSVARGCLSATTDGGPDNLPQLDPLQVNSNSDKVSGNLSPHKQEIRRLFDEISILIDQKRATEAEVKLRELEPLSPDPTDFKLGKAAIAIEKGDLATGRNIYLEFVDRDPKAFIPRFNLAELLMKETRYEAARKAFVTLLEQYPDNHLLMYKILLTYVVETKQKEAQDWLIRLNDPPLSPFFYYGGAAIAISNGDYKTGRKFILDADKRFGPGKLRWIHRSLEDLSLAIPRDYPPRQGGGFLP